jgi:hypothetical protein
MTLAPTLLVGALVLAVGAATCLLAASGRSRVAWTVAAALVLAISGVFLLGSVTGGEGQAGLALFLIVVVFFAPLLAASVIGTLAGLIARRLGRGTG